MDGLQLVQVVKLGLPHCTLMLMDEPTLCLRVLWYGIFDVSVLELDGYPVLLVTRPELEMDWQTTKVLQLLDSVLDEVMGESPWPD